VKGESRVDDIANIQLRAVYPLRELARAAGMDRRTLKGHLVRAGVSFLKTGTSLWVPISELELRVPALWESIKAAEMIRRLVAEDDG
jgi:hypothetical protein